MTCQQLRQQLQQQHRQQMKESVALFCRGGMEETCLFAVGLLLHVHMHAGVLFGGPAHQHPPCPTCMVYKAAEAQLHRVRVEVHQIKEAAACERLHLAMLAVLYYYY